MKIENRMTPKGPSFIASFDMTIATRPKEHHGQKEKSAEVTQKNNKTARVGCVTAPVM